MKTAGRNMIIICLLGFMLFPLSSCSRTVTIEDIDVEFWLSNDGGLTYFQGDGYHRGWGYSFFLKLRVRAHSDSNRAVFPVVSLHIGDSDNISAFIIGGPVVHPTPSLGRIIYEFNTRAVRDNDNFTELIVEFIPHRPDIVRMEVHFEFNDERLDDFRTYYGLNFLCICASIARNRSGRFDDFSSEALDLLRAGCNCARENCAYCFH